MTQFKEFPKMGRFSREFIITEKIDGTNASINIVSVEADEFPTEANIVATVNGLNIRVGSRTRWITPGDDNHGFAKWVKENATELATLGEGTHFGEWWGSGIQRGYGLQKGEKRFSLFNVSRWGIGGTDVRPACCHVVPELARGNFDFINDTVEHLIEHLKTNGSQASPGFMKPEGIVIFHTAANVGFKKTLEKDDTPKSLH
jgi:hypothetical protein